jgi:hypothetical protein
MSRLPFLTLPLLASLALGAAPPAGLLDDVSTEEQVLKTAGIGVDGASLLAFFRARTATEALQQQITEALANLGADTFSAREKATRDLIALGFLAVPALEQATRSQDLEVVRRAERCLKAIRSQGTELPRAALRVLAARRPSQAVEGLLAWLPSAGDESLEEEALAVLVRLGVREGRVHPAWLAAARDKAPLRRWAAAEGLARGTGEEARAAARRLLLDPEARVRCRAARALVQAGEPRAVPVLMALLEDAPAEIAWQAEELLYRLAGQHAPTLTLDVSNPASRARSRAAWQAWWKEKRDKVDLIASSQGERFLGWTITCECGVAGQENAGAVRASAADGKLLWQVTGIGNVTGCQLLPDGRTLIAQYRDQKIVERDRSGKVVWEHRLEQLPVCVQRLPNGNTLVGTLSGQLSELTREKKIVFERGVGGMVSGLHKARNGHLFYLVNGRIVELDAAGQQIRSIQVPGFGTWGDLEVLPGGRFLVASYGGNKVVELDGNGKVLWQCAAQQPASATRLRNGHTLVAESEGRRVLEFDRDGKEVGRQATVGRPFFVRRY